MKTCRWFLVGLFLPLAAAAQTPPQQPAPTLTKEQVEALKAKNAKLVEQNKIIKATIEATEAKDWAKAKDLAQKLIEAEARLAAEYPDDPSFARQTPNFYEVLGDAHFNLGEYEQAVAAYAKAVALGQELRAKGEDSEKLRKVLGTSCTSEGNACLKLKKSKEAIACFERAVEFDPNPATAWFNLCATEYNIGETKAALAAADKVIALDPRKADAYFIKGSLLFGDAKMDASGKIVVPPEAIAALKKYLELAPHGPHVEDVKQMLEFAGMPAP